MLTSKGIFRADRDDLLDVDFDIEFGDLEDIFVDLVHLGHADARGGVLRHGDSILSVEPRAVFSACVVDGFLVCLQNRGNLLNVFRHYPHMVSIVLGLKVAIRGVY